VNEIANGTNNTILQRVGNNIMSISTLIFALGTVVLAAVSYRQVGIMEADQRPWIGVGALNIDQHFDFTNTGGRPFWT
jgi:hypothetical protein